MWAASENHADAIRVLAEAGADLNARSTVLDAPVLEFPRSGGPNSPLPRGGWTALMFAARDGAIDAARALADLGADLNATALPQTDVPLKPEEIAAAQAKNIGTSALVYAIINVHYDLAAMLLDKGADPNVVDGAGMGALYAAVDMSSLQWVQGRPAPILSDQMDGADLVKRLLAKGANPNARLSGKPLKRHHDAGSTLNFGEGTTPLIRAARTNDVAVMKALLDGGADPFLTLPDRTTALMIAAGQGYGGIRGEGIRIVVPTPESAVEALTLLLDRGMDVDAFNNTGNTALHAAVGRGDAVVKFLASRGASLNLKNKAGFTPLDIALGQGGRGRGGRGGGVVRESTAALLRELMQQAPAKSGAPVASSGPPSCAGRRRTLARPSCAIPRSDDGLAVRLCGSPPIERSRPDSMDSHLRRGVRSVARGVSQTPCLAGYRDRDRGRRARLGGEHRVRRSRCVGVRAHVRRVGDEVAVGVEEAREASGLLIVAAWMVVCGVRPLHIGKP